MISRQRKHQLKFPERERARQAVTRAIKRERGLDVLPPKAKERGPDIEALRELIEVLERMGEV